MPAKLVVPRGPNPLRKKIDFDLLTRNATRTTIGGTDLFFTGELVLGLALIGVHHLKGSVWSVLEAALDQLARLGALFHLGSNRHVKHGVVILVRLGVGT